MKKLTQLQFLDKAEKKHNKKYSYPDLVYVSGKHKIKIDCPKHGLFYQRADAHANGQGCPDCAKINTPKKKIENKSLEVIAEMTLVHGGLYTYENFVYNGDKEQSLITCRVHGDFKQAVGAHKVGKGCIKCARETQFYRKSDYLNLCKRKNNSKSSLYILKILDRNGVVFYKVGITIQSIRGRFSKSKIPYNYEVLKNIESDAELVFDTEIKIKDMLSDFRYKPLVKFSGSTYECFSLITENAMMLINELEAWNES